MRSEEHSEDQMFREAPPGGSLASRGCKAAVNAGKTGAQGQAEQGEKDPGSSSSKTEVARRRAEYWGEGATGGASSGH